LALRTTINTENRNGAMGEGEKGTEDFDRKGRQKGTEHFEQGTEKGTEHFETGGLYPTDFHLSD